MDMLLSGAAAGIALCLSALAVWAVRRRPSPHVVPPPPVSEPVGRLLASRLESESAEIAEAVTASDAARAWRERRP